MDFMEEMQRQKMGFRKYIEALEEERRKIEHFRRELPLCLELVTQTVEACRQQLSGTTTEYNLNGQSECSEQTSTQGPVLEEFIPIKKRTSPDSEEDDEDEQHSNKPKIAKDNKNTDKKKSEWLRSVQLWNPAPSVLEDVPRKASVVEVKRDGGAFQPFHREESSGKSNMSAVKVPYSVASTGSVEGGSHKKEEKDGQTERKQRRCWSQELHKRFLQALQQLGGADSATPKQIRELMKVDGLTNDEVKSHLQKFRLYTRRPSSMVHNNGTPQAGPFLLVGNIFVQPPAVTTVSTAPSGGIFTPVASHLPTVPPLIQNPHLLDLQQSEHEERVNHSSEGAAHSSSPSSSSCTHAAGASPGR